MKSLTIFQPYASLLACRAKIYETRSWATNYRGPIAIHAAKKDPFNMLINTGGEALKAMSKVLFDTIYFQISADFCKLPRGCVIATAELVGCLKITRDITGKIVILERDNRDGTITQFPIYEPETLFGDFTPGRYAWEFANMKILPEPVPAKGQQGLWNWEGDGR